MVMCMAKAVITTDTGVASKSPLRAGFFVFGLCRVWLIYPRNGGRERQLHDSC